MIRLDPRPKYQSQPYVLTVKHYTANNTCKRTVPGYKHNAQAAIELLTVQSCITLYSGHGLIADWIQKMPIMFTILFFWFSISNIVCGSLICEL